MPCKTGIAGSIPGFSIGAISIEPSGGGGGGGGGGGSRPDGQKTVWTTFSFFVSFSSHLLSVYPKNNMFWVHIRTDSLRRFFWVPKAYGKVENSNALFFGA